MFDIVLYEPEIPPNTGNIIRLCANTGCRLHLIRPLGFDMDNKLLRRAGLDYSEFASVQIHDSLDDLLGDRDSSRVFAISTKGQSSYDEPQFMRDDIFLFGPETRGLPDQVRRRFSSLRIPMKAHSRSLNLANAVAIVVFEGWRQLRFIE
ncbi:MAG: tRNA (cytidine(34)-2'-O)-methyltransferase [Gammaproteobacteria bacterium]|jgi:tRNA (cytidine/uridine-2'-O-)-methyltransferase|nr:tRNA (cytidine(34)-2'-O)-methyltransferase [Gammaproteobacteria bacterium]MBT4493441.1 tRNA (cytidine(34)-2'-O)-methyltransferase [Gammaproteobacteria bacterium]MBT7371309.1 tRNA (cytidine(34)-2'-O)-methyltransferase [Gammaproteobacteria bacterium]